MQICIEELGSKYSKWFDIPVSQSSIDRWVEQEIQPIYDKEKLGGIPEEFEVVDTQDIYYLGAYTPIEIYNQYYRLQEEYNPLVIEYLIDELGYSVEQILQNESVAEEQVYYECSLEEYVDELLDNRMFGELNDTIRYYIDNSKIGRDLILNGDINEYVFDYKDYIFMNN